MMSKTKSASFSKHLSIMSMIIASAAVINTVNAEENLTLEEILVTAQKREQGILEVPAAVSAISAEILDNAGINDFSGITAVTPSLTIKGSGNNTNASVNLRGIGTYAFSIGVEPSVLVMVDDVPVVQQAQAFNGLADIAQIEVLRGPQATLFGKNSSAGVINIVTAGPTDEFEGTVETSITDDDEWRVNASISGPLGTTAGYRLSAYQSDRDGHITNLTDGNQLNGKKDFGVRGKLVMDPTDNLSLQLIADYSESDVLGNAATFRTIPEDAKLFGQVPASAFTAGINPGEGNFNTRLDYVPRSDNEQLITSLKFNYALGDYNLVGVTSYQDWNYIFEQDVDGTQAPIAGLMSEGMLSGGIYQTAPFEADQLTQELRLESPINDDYDYILGLWYSSADTERTFKRAPLPNLAANWQASTSNTNRAIFGQLNLHLSERLDLSLGGRYGQEDIEVYFNNLKTSSEFQGEDSDSYAVGKLSLQYRLQDNLFTFASVSSGYKGQGYDVSSSFNQTTADEPVASENSISYEAGIKGDFNDGRGRFSLVGFVTDYKDFQAQGGVLTEQGLELKLNNVGELRTVGIEADMALQMTDAWRLDAGLAIIDATIQKFENAQCYPPRSLAGNCSQDISGKELANSPNLKFNAGLTYQAPVEGKPYALFANLNYAYQADVNFDLYTNPRTVQEAYGIANLNVGLEDIGGRYRISAFVNNLFDQFYAGVISDSSGFYAGKPVMLQQVPRNAQRYMGVKVRFSF